ncbi:MAG: DegT/DnrJ/EryC1/StrS family aminotransferase [Crocinitomicaceae bacterium]
MIFVNEPDLEGNSLKYLKECIETNWISSEGPFVRKFETDFAKKVGRKYGMAVTNGSVALDLALKALGVQKDDEVIVPTFTIISPVASIVQLGAKPVLIDSRMEDWNMDVSQIESKINSKTKAIVIVHIYGLPVDVDPILALAKKYNLKVVEDAAEMHGQIYKGSPCGSFGDVSTFSFYPNKHVTTGEGGMIVTDNEEIAEKVKSYRNLCFSEEKRFVHHELGTNARFTNLQAAVGLAQLERLDEFVIKKRAIGKFYHEAFKDLDNIILPPVKNEAAENIYWVFGIILKRDSGLKTSEVTKRLSELGVQTRPFFYPMHLQPVFQKMGLFKREEYPVSEFMSDNGFYIPSGLKITDEQLKIVAQSVKKVVS